MAEAGFDVRIPPTVDLKELERTIREEWAPASLNLSVRRAQPFHSIPFPPSSQPFPFPILPYLWAIRFGFVGSARLSSRHSPLNLKFAHNLPHIPALATSANHHPLPCG